MNTTSSPSNKKLKINYPNSKARPGATATIQDPNSTKLKTAIINMDSLSPSTTYRLLIWEVG